ncbi:SusC/RagA family TonB-linked outer membrane protein [Mucilaginibacter sp. BT774]|uniref:SusC/RagA family TonB-linked outer membrane protein n=1 Tax=Mucilaginibacter sp. BT774 TaxID=3062276 RepID=UPI0026766AA9|nr:SusC/RagA family TonB-linked outer membrane protein [Mucilaginibacter sp. BT774]MDO3628838.1 SusC/RagA family TonB-linked outer membrane protein [Mucilaginibacter sp. BT774]
MRIGIISIFILATSIPVFSATPAKSQTIEQVAVNITLKNESLVKAFHKIESQSPFHFMYRNEDVKDVRNLEITASNQSLAVFLKTILSNTSLKFRQIDNQILITKSNPDKIAADGKTDAANDGIVASKGVIKGTVTDAKGGPLPGVTVKLDGVVSLNKATDVNGIYSFANLPAGNYTLTFTFVGYKTVTKTITLGEDQERVVDAVLAETTNNLDEIIVTGYGTQKKREVTSAITSINAAQFNKGNISDVSQLLQGKVPGLSIARPGGDPNGGFAIRLRGLSTIGTNTQPLIVVDDQVDVDINTIDPNDIKSIDVLKDGSSAAIYGTRGSAGVIIITTKTGRKGTSKFTYNVSGTAETPAKFTQHMNAAQFRALGKGTDFGSNTDWDKEITRTALSYVHNLGFSGGDERTTYDASLNYRNSEGVAIMTGFKQLNARLNLTHKALNDRLVFIFNINTTNRKNEEGFPDAFKYATIFNPTAPVHSTNPLYDLTGGGYFESNFVDYSNPVAMLEQNTNERTIKKFNVGGSVTYEIIKDLKFSTQYYKQTSSNYHSEYSPIDAFISRGFPLGSGFGRSGLSVKNDDETENALYQNTLSYETAIKKMHVSAVAGYSYQDYLYQGFGAGGGNFVTDASRENFGAALDFVNGIGSVTSYKNENKLISFFGRVNLNYDNIAFLSASLRRDGSSEFGVDSKWGYFPAVSAGLDISKLVTIPTVSNLKVRGSYGITGALPVGPYYSLSRLTTTGTYYAGGGVYAQTYGTFVNANPKLKWEKKTEADLGLDFTLLDGRLSGTFDYFNRKTKDLIFNVTVPSPPAINNNTWENIGELTNSGVELALNYEAIRGSNFSWTPGGNISSYHVVLTALNESLKGSYVGATNLGTPGQEATQLTRAVEGQPIGILYGPKYVGVDANGTYLYSDGKGGTTGLANAPRQVIGNGLPKFEFGITNAFKYKNFDFNFFLRSSIGHQLINTYRAFYENPNIATSYNVVNTKYFNPKVTDGAAYSSYDVEKGDFLKLDNATLGYTFKIAKSDGKSGMISSLRVYLSGQNLFTITGYTGVDPEVRYADGIPANPLAPGIDRRETWVYTRSFTFGINMGF